MTHLRKRAVALCFCGLVGLVLQGNADAQNARHLTRGQLWSSFRENGTAGNDRQDCCGSGYTGFIGMQYPGSDAAADGGDFREYWGDLGSFVTAMHRQNNTSRGEGVWVVTKPPGASMHKFSRSGGRAVSSDIRAMQFDPSADPTMSDLGTRDLAPRVVSGRVSETGVIPTGTEKSNWWPGQTTWPDEDKTIEIHNYDWFKYQGQISRDNAAPEIVVSKWTTGNGVTTTRKAYAWGQQDFDDFIIVEYEFENTGDTNGDGAPDPGFPVQLNETYFVTTASFKISESSSTMNHFNQFYGDWGPSRNDWWRWTESANYLTAGTAEASTAWSAGKPSMVGRKMIYQMDGDTHVVPVDDTGKPFRNVDVNLGCAGGALALPGQIEGELLSYHMVGFAPLDLDPADGFTGDPETGYKAPRNGAASQPYNVWRTFSWEALNSAGWSDDRMAQEWLKPLDRTEAYDFDVLTQSSSSELIRDDNSFFPSSTYDSGMMWGPYDLAPGDKAKIVMAFVAAAPVEDDIYGWARSGSVNQAAAQTAVKNDNLNMLEKHLDRAQWIYDHGYDIPDEPPDVFARVVSNTLGSVNVSWSNLAESAQNSDYTGDEATDVAGYHVYRSDGAWKGHLGPWTLIANVPAGGTVSTPQASSTLSGGVYTLTDLTAVAGFAYWYSVRAYSSGHLDWTGDITINAQQGTYADLPEEVRNNLNSGLEAARGAPESRTSLSLSPQLPGNTQADALTEKVRVVPNPYKLDQVHSYGQSRNIRFTNIPRRVRISIFSASGDLVTEISRDTPGKASHPDTGAEVDAWTIDPAELTWTQGSRSGLGTIATGIYFFVVENLDTGAKQDGRFLIIR
jgi:hypothetical protein